MDKILTINLGGIAIKIEENAFLILSQYIKELESYFKMEENGHEIVNDIESRMAEMLLEKSHSKPAIDVNDVNQVINTMGKPNQFDSEQNTQKNNDNENTNSTFQKKKLYRDNDKKIIGGVCSGLAHYFNIDPMIVRLIWLIAFLFFGTGLIFYLIMVLIVPKADTPVQKMAMSGTQPTLDNIIHDLKSNASGLANQITKNQGINDIISFVSKIVKFLFRTVLSIFGITIFILSCIIIMGIFTNFSHFEFGNHPSIFFGIPNVYNTSWEYFSAKFLIGMVILIPIFIVLLKIISFVFNYKIYQNDVKKVINLIWILCVPFAIYFVFRGFHNFKNYEETHINNPIRLPKNFQISLNTKQNSEFNHAIYIEILKSKDSLCYIEYVSGAYGSSNEKAIQNLNQLNIGYQILQNQIILNSPNFKNQVTFFNKQMVYYKLYLTDSMVFTLNQNLKNAQIHIFNNRIHKANIDSTKQFMLFNNQIECKTCTEDNLIFKNSNTTNLDFFDKVDINGSLNVEFIKSDQLKIEDINGNSISHHDGISINNNTLKLSNQFNKLNQFKTIRIYYNILTSIEVNGASSALIDYIEYTLNHISVNGSSLLEIKNCNLNDVNIDINGASELKMSGQCNTIDIDIEGSSEMLAYNINSQTVNANISGASQLEIGNVNTLKGECSGSSIIKYKKCDLLDIKTSDASDLIQKK